MATQDLSGGSLAVRPYQPEGGYSGTAWLGLMIVMLVAALAAGFVAHFISQWLYLIVLFPIGIGLGVGYCGAAAAKVLRMRSPIIGGFAGLACGFAAMFCMHYFDYRTLLSDTASMPAEVKAALEAPEAEFKLAIAEQTPETQDALKLAREASNVHSFGGYMDLMARQGVTISKAGSSSRGGINLGYVGTYIYWLVEIGLVCIVSWMVVKGAASEPFCGQCQQWRKEQKLGYINSGLDESLRNLTEGNLTEIPKVASSNQPSPVSVTAFVCPACQASGEIDVKVQHTVEAKKGKTETKTLAFMTYPAGSLGTLQAAFPAQQAQAPATTDQAAAALEAMTEDQS